MHTSALPIPLTFALVPSIDLRPDFCRPNAKIGFPAEHGCLDAIDAMPAGSVRKPDHSSGYSIQRFTFRDWQQ